MKCNRPKELEEINDIYKTYFNSWNYNYKKQNEAIEELAPGKTVFFISRNQDSPNLFHGNSEIINAISDPGLVHLTYCSPKIYYRITKYRFEDDSICYKYQKLFYFYAKKTKYASKIYGK